MQRMRNLSTRTWMLIGAGALVVVLVVVAALVLLPRTSADDVAQDFADALPTGDLESAGWTPAGIDDDYRQTVEGLGGLDDSGPLGIPTVTVASVDQDGDSASAVLDWSWPQGERAWDYSTTMQLTRDDGEWTASYAPSVVHADLEPGDALRAHSSRATRGKILGADDEVLSDEMPVVRVGIEPRRMEDPEDPDEIDELTAELGEHLDIDADALSERLEAAEPDVFVPVITLRRDDYDEVSGSIRLLPGTVFQEDTQPLNRSREFAAATLGSVGEATAEDIEKSDGKYAAGDVLGRSGLNRAFDDLLRGEDTLVIQRVTTDAEDDPVELARLEGQDGDTITTTLDVEVQDAADDVLADVDKPAALVALRPSDGHVLAAANHDPDGGAFDRALTGRYPPGSVFKVASALAMLRDGTGVDDVLSCPESTTVDGRTFTNAGDLVLGETTFEEIFTESCNTAFVDAGSLVDGDQLAAAAADLGLDGSGSTLLAPNLAGSDGLPDYSAFLGESPSSDDPVTHAAMMIGQGHTEASPLGAAVMAASVARGERVAPVLVTDAGTGVEDSADTAPEAAAGSPSDGTAEAGSESGSRSGTEAATTEATVGTTEAAVGTTEAAVGTTEPAVGTGELESEHVEALQHLMEATVEEGTASALADVPGEPVHGKTGTAEYGEETPPRTHAWFIGYQDDLAVAVLVEDGGFGAEAAVPLAEDFFRLIND